HPDDRERLTKAVLRAHDPEGAGFFDIEYRIVRRDGAVRWLSVRSQTFFEGEGDKRRPVRTVGAIIDITAAKQAQATQAKLEEQLRQAQKLESIGQLAGGIAHDFNNLLVPIIGYTELAQMQLSANSKIYNDLEKIRNAAERAASLTRQLLAFSRRQVLEVKVLDLNEVIRGFQEIVRRLISEAITVQVLLASGPGLIKADRSQIE
ncbi:MAG: PAS domain-containing protein, partial [Anaerolineae bacterium]|nr:PAS domain-containing protein [Anaerolineae bacterium]